MTPEALEEATRFADIITNAGSLGTLHRALIAFQALVNPREDDIDQTLDLFGINIAELPTFGGDEPKNTTEVWSWDKDYLLVEVGPFSDWRIVHRDDAEWTK